MKEEFESLEDLKKALAQHMQEVNTAPREEMDNLSANDMQLILYHTTPQRQYSSCYYIRVFDRFLAHYGFVEIEKTRIPDSYDHDITIKATDHFYQIFEIRPDRFQFQKAAFSV